MSDYTFVAQEQWNLSPNLRFVMRDGQRILQQLWYVGHDFTITEWRDVPLEVEGAPE